jgi:hypothetical protein
MHCVNLASHLLFNFSYIQTFTTFYIFEHPSCVRKFHAPTKQHKINSSVYLNLRLFLIDITEEEKNNLKWKLILKLANNKRLY